MVSKSQRRAAKKWDDAHRKSMRIYRYRSACRRFIKSYATLQDINKIQQLLVERKQHLS